jgi:hypothetical protein
MLSSLSIVFWRTARGLLLLLITSACNGQEGAELSLFLNFDTTPSSVFVRAMEKELAAILEPADLHLHWLAPKQKAASDTWRSMIFSFHGNCAVGSGDFVPPIKIFALANTPVSGGVVQPYSRMDCDQLRDFLEAYAPSHLGEEARLGRAMGRILAHELYHVLLQTRLHSKTGIAKAVHTPAALLGRSLKFENGELEKIRERYGLTPAAQNTSFAAN